jgi:hypothetical protein
VEVSAGKAASYHSSSVTAGSTNLGAYRPLRHVTSSPPRCSSKIQLKPPYKRPELRSSKDANSTKRQGWRWLYPSGRRTSHSQDISTAPTFTPRLRYAAVTRRSISSQTPSIRRGKSLNAGASRPCTCVVGYERARASFGVGSRTVANFGELSEETSA